MRVGAPSVTGRATEGNGMSVPSSPAGMSSPPETARPGSPSFLRLLVWGLTLAALAGVVYYAYLYFHPGQPATPPVSTVPARTDSIVAAVHSSGQIAPWNEARLSFQTSGMITSLPVRVGDRVKKGDVIASLDQTQLKIQLEQAQAN